MMKPTRERCARQPSSPAGVGAAAADGVAAVAVADGVAAVVGAADAAERLAIAPSAAAA